MGDGTIPGERRFPALALVNTRSNRPGGPADALSDAAGARVWLTGKGLLPEAAEVTEADAERLRAFRESIRTLLGARAAGTVPPEEAVKAVNAVLTAPSLVWDEGGPRRVPGPAAGAVETALARLAADAVDLLTGADASSLTACGASGCIRLFLRTHGARQWCSTRCGDRVRAARYYARRRGAS
jgi:predicted RNA-binding Zn ribbon-like protein